MIKYFIFYDDLSYANLLSDMILKSNNNVKLVGLAKKLSKSNINNCQDMSPHVIISTKDLHKKLSKTLDFYHYTIIIPQNSQLVTMQILNKIKKLTATTKYSLKLDFYNFRKSIIYKLENLNFNLALSGTQYLIECLMYIHQYPNFKINRPSLKHLFLLVANKYNITTDIVVWNIHTAITDMCKYTTSEFRKSTYGKDYGITAAQIISYFIS